ncbi:hypothetical protein DV736_g5364, partial [Chaetothyriales sp. CBS 134916]
MSLRKRRASDGAQMTAKCARTKTRDSRLDQEITGPSDFPEPREDFKIEVKLRSTSKAARNDPQYTLPQRELYQKTLSELSNGGPTTDEHRFATSRAVQESSTFHDEDESDNQVKITPDNGGNGKIRENDPPENVAFDDNCEFKWLEPIDVKVTSATKLDKRGKPMRVAYCEAKLIRRDQMRDDFYGEMELPSQETSMLAFNLFDRYGRLRSEFITHLVIKGTGIWGQELDHGDILLIEKVFVDKYMVILRFRLAKLLKIARSQLEWDSLQDDVARYELEDREHDRAVTFHRSLGFRRVGSTIWFAMASDNHHPSHQISSTEDFYPPKASSTCLHPLLIPFSQMGGHPRSGLDRILNSEPREYPDFLGVQHSCMQEKGSADSCWMSKDKDGDTVLHLAASIFNVACVDWILNQDFGTRLLEMRNNRGETPLELLQFKLEKIRTQ